LSRHARADRRRLRYHDRDRWRRRGELGRGLDGDRRIGVDHVVDRGEHHVEHDHEHDDELHLEHDVDHLLRLRLRRWARVHERLGLPGHPDAVRDLRVRVRLLRDDERRARDAVCGRWVDLRWQGQLRRLRDGERLSAGAHGLLADRVRRQRLHQDPNATRHRVREQRGPGVRWAGQLRGVLDGHRLSTVADDLQDPVLHGDLRDDARSGGDALQRQRRHRV
jgi:hypothetical protein